MSTLDFLSPDNLCGASLIRIVSRGSAIIAELLRLSDNIPDAFQSIDRMKDAEQKKYASVLFDFHYLRDPEEYDGITTITIITIITIITTIATIIIIIIIIIIIR